MPSRPVSTGRIRFEVADVVRVIEEPAVVVSGVPAPREAEPQLVTQSQS